MGGTMHSNYRVVASDDFASMVVTSRYASRSSAFEEMIGRTAEHFWNPEDPDYIDFSSLWDMDEPILPFDFVIESHTAVWDKLDERQRVRFVNETARWMISNLLHGEQGALNLSASLCHMFLDPGAQEYAANQAREEARHVHAFTRYVESRFGSLIFPVGDTIGAILTELVQTQVVYKKIVGMQMLIEGIAMGAFATMFQVAHDPVLRRLCQLIMTDEAFHHRFGKVWARATIPELPEPDRVEIEDWAVEIFNHLLLNLVNAEQKRLIFPQFGLDWQWVRGAVMEALSDDARRERMKEPADIFRTLVKTLLSAGIITDRTRGHYAMWLDMDELAKEGDRLLGDEFAEEATRELRLINSGKRKIIRRLSA